MQTSQYVKAVPVILAEVEKGWEEEGHGNAQPDTTSKPEKMHVYPAIDEEGNVGFLITKTPLPPEEPEETIVESREPETHQRPWQCIEPPYFLHFLLLLLLFVGLDSADTTLTMLFSPTASITILPQQKAISTTATFLIGTGPHDVQGRVLPALTLSQSQTVAATGRGHQDARYATGTLRLYNGSFAPQTIDTGTVYTGADGVQVAIDQAITVPAATSGNPPQFGQAFVSAHAIHAGATGNVPVGDISITTSTLQVRNSQFSGGQDARDFTFITKGDIQHASNALTPISVQSERGALSAQLQAGETLTTPQCTPRVFSNHQNGDEAASVQVTVSEACKAIAYSQQSLQTAASQVVHVTLMHLRTQYQLIGPIQITVRSVSMQNGGPTLTATIHGVWVYQISEGQLKSLVAGKPRLIAIQLLSKRPGVQSITIAGISDNSPLPNDLSHIHILILVEG